MYVYTFLILTNRYVNEVCKSVNDISHFKRRDTNETFNILKGPLDCNSNNVTYLFECQQCQNLSKHVEKDLEIVIKKSKLKQKLFHEHYCSEDHQGIENWSVTLIDQVEDLDSLRKKELYWINRLNTWAPNGFNLREVCEAYN